MPQSKPSAPPPTPAVAALETGEPVSDPWKPSPSTARKVRAWIDLDQVGPAEFYRWLETVVTLLPPPDRRPPRPTDSDGRISQLAHSLVESAQAEARAHFQASEYFRENSLLARRLKALEAIIVTAGLPLPPGSRATEVATEHFLPQKANR
ncbi:MAG: hypothetical protein ACREB9_00375 [Thermoplasmata archaeon]